MSVKSPPSTSRFVAIKAGPSGTPISGAVEIDATGGLSISESGDVITITGAGPGLVNPMTSRGDMITSFDTVGTPGRLPVGAGGQILAIPTVGTGSAYDGQVIQDAPWNYWRLAGALTDGGAHNDPFSLNSTGAHGTLNSTGGPFGDGDVVLDQDQTLDASGVTAPSGAWTLEFLLNIISGTQTVQLMELDASTHTGRVNAYIDGNKLAYNNSGTVIDSTFTFALNTWTHCAIVWDGTNLTFWANGSQVGQSSPSIMAAESGVFVVPHSSLSGFWGNVAASRIAIYNSALSSARIGAHYAEFSNGGVVPTWESPATIGLASDPTTTEGDILYRHSGALARLPVGGANTLLHGGTDPTYSAVVEGDLSLSDVTTANVSTTKHGFAPKAPNDATKYLDGTGAYSVPSGSGTGMTDPTTTKGDLIVHGSTTTRLGVGSDGQVLTANSAATNGVDWETPSSSGATYYHVNSDTATSVTDAAGDYDAPGLSISSVPSGTYLAVCDFVGNNKSGEVGIKVTDGSNTLLWPKTTGDWESRHNQDSEIEGHGAGLIVLSSTSTVKIRFRASGAIGNFTIGSRHLTLIKIA